MAKKMEVEFAENQKKIEKLIARNKDIEMRMKARTKYKNRKERTHKMCQLAGDIEKKFKEVVGENLFDDGFAPKREWLLKFFDDDFGKYNQRFGYQKIIKMIEETQKQLAKEKEEQSKIEKELEEDYGMLDTEIALGDPVLDDLDF